MRAERRILQERVFPDLKKYCEVRGASFQAVDLRWGVNEESQREQKTMEICLTEIARCQRLSPRPNFICFSVTATAGSLYPTRSFWKRPKVLGPFKGLGDDGNS